MPAATKKRPPLEMEPGEGKAHESAESVAEETREGSEPDDAPKASRKRSAKNAKNTKAPMDGDCSCGGRKGKASCDGGCGGYAKKMDRNDALTPQEYLAACELGIQGRSRPYIRARLDATERLDLKCGNGSISEGEKCTKGSASRPQGTGNKAIGRNTLKRAAGNTAIVIGTVGNLATAYGAVKGMGTLNSGDLSKAIQRQAAFSALAGAGYRLKAGGTTNKQEKKQLQASGNALLTSATIGGVAGHSLGGGYTKGLTFSFKGYKKPNFANTAANIKGRASALKGAVVQRKSRASLERMYMRSGRRDSVYAAGFSPELDQLAI